MDILIVANGDIKSKKFHREAARGKDIIIAADGGADNCIKIGIKPDYVIGDLDSISSKARKKFQSKIIHKKDQNSTDLEKAIHLAKKLKCRNLDIIGAIGDRMDHTISNIISLSRINVPCRIVDEKNEVYLVNKKINLTGKKGDIVSIIPISRVKGLSYSGLKWEVKNKTVETGWLGMSNEMAGKKSTVGLKSGKIIVAKIRK